ncbi:PAS domain-containing protein [Sphingomonas sp. BT-65]|uniref:PAS domain-containing protein n=1 Tax=Sphingomonas sp. BT-65 TaxID=2989821 RepID=UPI002235E24A|nr:PAS domain-containing protein [Sphingomonas sp. BT-65]MCW4463066.1 PAS domain-containing protein [Sphingomonas sp. BT-65]
MTGADAALIFAGPDGVIRIWNAAAERLLGHHAEEAIGRRMDLVIPPDYRDRHWAGFNAAMAAADGVIDHLSYDIPALHRDGTVLRIEVRLLVVHDSRNRVVGAVAVFTPADAEAPPLERL